jgi:hypothetical protein
MIVCITPAAVSTTFDVDSSPTTAEAMLAPAMTIAPAGPGTHTEEDPVEKESRPIKAYGCAGIGRSFVIAVGADRRNVNINHWRWNADLY